MTRPATILVIAMRRLGDVLLTTPLVRSLKAAYPEAAIDMLVFRGTEGILQGNPDLRRVIAVPPKPTTVEAGELAGRLFRAYDLAISTQTGDRPIAFTALAGRTRVGPRQSGVGGRVKALALSVAVDTVPNLHRVVETLRLASAIGVTPVAKVVPPAGGHVADPPAGPYAVLHAAPMFRYKRWTSEGWRALVRALRDRGLTVVATGGPDEDERRMLDAIFADLDVDRRDGRLSWPDLADLLARSRLYVGPDTSVTHLAAAVGVPTVALFGPTDPRLWGPWPAEGLSEPWKAVGPQQRRGNVHIVQNPQPCLPCQLEGCERRLDSPAKCLDEMSTAQVLTAVERALAVEAA